MVVSLFAKAGRRKLFTLLALREKTALAVTKTGSLIVAITIDVSMVVVVHIDFVSCGKI